VVEADEYDRSFLQLHPRLALITGIDAEHLDCYGDLTAAFGPYWQSKSAVG
jgi:UDP-N-acetylmuramate-alanine ligase